MNKSSIICVILSILYIITSCILLKMIVSIDPSNSNNDAFYISTTAILQSTIFKFAINKLRKKGREK